MAHRLRCGGNSAARTGRTHGFKLSQFRHWRQCNPGKCETPGTRRQEKPNGRQLGVVCIALVRSGLYGGRVGIRLTTSSHAILGLLSIAPMSGYDLFQAVERSVGRFWPISKSQVYAELPRLESAGLIQGTDVHQERLPDKRVFRLTEAGEVALDAWLEDSELEVPQFRVPFLLKTLFGHRRQPADTAALLRAVQGEAAAAAGQYQEFLELLNSVPDSAYARVTVLFGLRVAEAMASWAREAMALLPERAHRIDPRREPRDATAMFRAAPAVRRQEGLAV
jgi:PadR family transcriptional regulator, regulatory protein AphA